jgi:hypothetical protein
MKNYWLDRKAAREKTEARWKRIEMTVKDAIKKVTNGN